MNVFKNSYNDPMLGACGKAMVEKAILTDPFFLEVNFIITGFFSAGNLMSDSLKLGK